MKNQNKLRVGIIGTGNIGTDLLIKILKSERLTCSIFAGRSFSSPGINLAKNLGVCVSEKGINAILESPGICDILIDCTSAEYHKHNWQISKELGIPMIDMTPAKLGIFCIPSIDVDICHETFNLNMVTCGGQTSIPIVHAISSVYSDIEYVEVVSNIASRSAGPATRANLDEYIDTTSTALKHFSGAAEAKVILVLNPSEPPIDMKTTIYLKMNSPDIQNIRKLVNKAVKKIQKYSPGYQLISTPTIFDGVVVINLKVLGAGDYLPQYAGNLDIINCAAIAVLENYYKQKYE